MRENPVGLCLERPSGAISLAITLIAIRLLAVMQLFDHRMADFPAGASFAPSGLAQLGLLLGSVISKAARRVS